MAKSRLKSLLIIAERQSDQQLQTVRQRQSELDRLAAQRNDLQSYLQSYLHPVVDGREVLPTLLTHRLRFVEELDQQVRLLDQQVGRLQTDLATSEHQWRLLSARQQAIQALHTRSMHQQQIELERSEQKILDEVSRLCNSNSMQNQLKMGCEDA